MAVLAREQELRPRRAALLVVGPLHLVEHENVSRPRRHLDGAAEDRGVVVDALLPCHETHLLGTELGREPAVSLLREHPQRPA